MAGAPGERATGERTTPEGAGHATAGTGISRRALLAAVTATGAAGALTGAGVRAFLTDSEPFPGNLFQAGTLELCWEEEGDCIPTSNVVPVTLGDGDLQDGDGGVATIRCLLPDPANNPAWVWLRTNCPGDVCGLEQAVRLTISYDEGCDGEATRPLRVEDDSGDFVRISDVRLCDALRLLRRGVVVDGDPATRGTDDPHEPGCRSRRPAGTVCGAAGAPKGSV